MTYGAGMVYEDDGYMGYVLTATYGDNTMGIADDRIFGDRIQTQELAARRQREEAADGGGSVTRYGVGGIVPIPDVPTS